MVAKGFQSNQKSKFLGKKKKKKKSYLSHNCVYGIESLLVIASETTPTPYYYTSV